MTKQALPFSSGEPQPRRLSHCVSLISAIDASILMAGYLMAAFRVR